MPTNGLPNNIGVKQYSFMSNIKKNPLIKIDFLSPMGRFLLFHTDEQSSHFLTLSHS